MDLGIANRRALVPAATGGLGFAACRSLPAEGVHVAMVDRDKELLHQATEALAGEFPVTVEPIVCDLEVPSSRHSMIEAALKRMGGIDILVNITGGPPSGPISDLDGDGAGLRPYFDSMVLSVIHITNRVPQGMRARGWGRIVTSTSSGVIQPIQPIQNPGISNALRASLVTWSKTLAAEVAAEGVTVNIVVPG